MTNPLDCRGLDCPEPVIRTREYIIANLPESLAVIVDNQAARENVTRLMQSQGYAVSVSEDTGNWRLEAKKTGDAPRADVTSPVRQTKDAGDTPEKILVFVPTHVLGYGDDELGARLMRNFLLTLPEMGTNLWCVIFVNGGVKLTIRESPVLEQLQVLENMGVSILVCGACLEYFGLTDKKAVGTTTNMLDIVTSLQLADKVLRV
jgi:selenium metabolism protein YedF